MWKIYYKTYALLALLICASGVSYAQTVTPKSKAELQQQLSKSTQELAKKSVELSEVQASLSKKDKNELEAYRTLMLQNIVLLNQSIQLIDSLSRVQKINNLSADAVNTSSTKKKKGENNEESVNPQKSSTEDLQNELDAINKEIRDKQEQLRGSAAVAALKANESVKQVDELYKASYTDICASIDNTRKDISDLTRIYTDNQSLRQAEQKLTKLGDEVSILKEAEEVLKRQYSKDDVERSIQQLNTLQSTSRSLTNKRNELRELLTDYCLKNLTAWIAMKNCNRAASEYKSNILNECQKKVNQYPYLMNALEEKKSKLSTQDYCGVIKTICR